MYDDQGGSIGCVQYVLIIKQFMYKNRQIKETMYLNGLSNFTNVTNINNAQQVRLKIWGGMREQVLSQNQGREFDT